MALHYSNIWEMLYLAPQTLLQSSGVLCATVVGTVLIFVFRMIHLRKQTVIPGFKAVLITGCDSGFGFLLAQRLDKRGFKVFAGCLNVSGEGAQELVKSTSSKLELLQLDVTSEAQIQAAKVTVAELLMGNFLWAVVNNAGICHHAELEWYPKEEFRKTVETNLMGMVNVTRTFLPMIRASKGRIINMSSMAGRTAMPGFSAYAACKYGVIGFSESLRREMVHFGVKVIVIEPALYKTAMGDIDAISKENEEFWAKAGQGVKRDYGEGFFQDTQNSRRRVLGLTPRSDLNEVIDCYEEAVCSVWPKIRYSPPLVLSLSNDIMNTWPYAIQDRIIRWVTGIKVKPDMVCPFVVPDNCRMGRRRSHAN